MTITRTTIVFTSSEHDAFARLHTPEQIWGFWRRAAEARGLDYKSLFWRNNAVTGLPKDHGQHWCWPSPLLCRHKPSAEVVV